MTTPHSLVTPHWIDTVPVISEDEQQAISDAFDSLHQQVAIYINRYSAPAPLPLSIPEAMAEIDQLKQEIEEARKEYHVSHDQVIFRTSYLLFCLCLVERSYPEKKHLHLREQIRGWLDTAIGVSFIAALEIATHRYAHLVLGYDAQFIDQHILVPLAQRLLRLV